MLIRLFQVEDTAQVARLFHDTVRQINCQHYSMDQTVAWAPDDIHFTDWAQKCSNCLTYVAEDRGTIAGFAQLETNGHIDCFYVHKDYQGQGVGKQLYQALETNAMRLNLAELFVEASITAQPFFERMGFKTIQPQQVECRGQTFTNYKMEKRLQA